MKKSRTTITAPASRAGKAFHGVVCEVEFMAPRSQGKGRRSITSLVIVRMPPHDERRQHERRHTTPSRRVTVSELPIESFFPVDEATAVALERAVRGFA
jgi:hypothetical protein